MRGGFERPFFGGRFWKRLRTFGRLEKGREFAPSFKEISPQKNKEAKTLGRLAKLKKSGFSAD
jgi:hypothetical protein